MNQFLFQRPTTPYDGQMWQSIAWQMPPIYELNTPTIAPVMPKVFERWSSFSATNASWTTKQSSPSRGGLLPARPPLRTVLESFPSYGSSLSNLCALMWVRGGKLQPMRDESNGRLTLGRRCVSRGLAPAPPSGAAHFEVSSVVRIVGICGPTDFDMALDSSVGGFVQGEHLAFALFLGEPDAEDPFG